MPPAVREDMLVRENESSAGYADSGDFFDPLVVDGIFYPDSDGEPMADNTTQFGYIARLKAGFDAMYADRDDVFVAGDLLWYPVEGDPHISFAPDVLIAFDRPKGDRHSYKQWLENGQPPDVAFEVLSPKNTRKEMERKLEKYDLYGVKEYYEYDPKRGTLKGWLREDVEGGKLQPIEDIEFWQSPLTGVTFHLDEEKLVTTRPDGRVFLDSEETERELQALMSRAEAEAKRAETEATRADEAIKRAELLAEKLRQAGIDPDDI